jgi:hypothetical protein
MSADSGAGQSIRARHERIDRILGLAGGVLLLGFGITVAAGFTIGLVGGSLDGGADGLNFPETILGAIALLVAILGLGSYLLWEGVRKQRA